MKYNEAIEFLFYDLPNYHNTGYSAIRPGLDNIKKLSEKFNNPHKSYKIVHVGGTNGKGTSASSISNICSYNNLKVGLLTSPHIKDFRERITINGRKIDKDFIKKFISNNIKIIKNISPSFFELTTIMAFKYFELKKVDLAIIEVGLGGKLDCTNIVNPIISLISNVSLDHQNILGENIAEIAKEKSGIIKKNSIFIKGEFQPDIDYVFINKCNSLKVKYYSSTDKVKIETKRKTINTRDINVLIDKYKFQLTVSNPTNYYLNNLTGIIYVSFKVLKYFKIKITNKSFDGLSAENEKYKMPGRWQIHSKSPITILDGCHNLASINEIINEINQYSFNKIYFVIGGVIEKNWNKICSILPTKYIYILTEPNNSRALNVDNLKSIFDSYGLKYVTQKTVNNAIDYAKSKSKKNDLIFVGGSLFLISDLNEK